MKNTFRELFVKWKELGNLIRQPGVLNKKQKMEEWQRLAIELDKTIPQIDRDKR